MDRGDPVVPGMRLAIVILLLVSSTVSAAIGVPAQVAVTPVINEPPTQAPAYVPPPPTPSRHRHRSLTEILALLEHVRAAAKNMWFTSVKIDMDGRVKLNVLIRHTNNGRSCFGRTPYALEGFKKFENNFRSVRLKRITREPYLDRTVAAADLGIVLNEESTK